MSESSEMTGPDRNHCWHSTGLEYCSYPPQHEQKCCFCGAVRVLHYELVAPAGHGPHAPQELRPADGPGLCPARA